MYGKYIRYFTNPLKTGDIYAHAQTVCTRPLLGGGEGPGDEAKWIQATLCCVVLDCSYLMRNTTHFCGGHFLHSNRSYEGSHVECVLTV